MVRKIILIISIFVVILVALSFGETLLAQVLDWVYRFTGILVRNFADIQRLVGDYVRANGGRILLALLLTIPASVWILRAQSHNLGGPMAQRRIAIVLAIFLGWLGVHRFYLGQIGWGIGFLVLAWAVLPLAVIFGFADALRYALMDSEGFAASQAPRA